jgi:hypothetical protein
MDLGKKKLVRSHSDNSWITYKEAEDRETPIIVEEDEEGDEIGKLTVLNRDRSYMLSYIFKS